MEFDVWSFLVGNLEAAGAIGGYVSISIVAFALLTFASGDQVGAARIGPKWANPVVGAFLGVIPGCGATIVASTMYKNHRLSFGGLFAAFVATLGEGSFVLLGASDEADVAANLTAFAVVNAIGFVIGTLAGLGVDALGINVPPEELLELKPEEEKEHSGKTNTLVHLFIEKLGFTALLVMALFMAPGSIMALWGGGIAALDSSTVWVNIAFTVLSFVYFFAHKFLYKGHDCGPQENVNATLLHAFFDITMVVVYVSFGLVVANYLIDVVVGPEAFDAWMTSSAGWVVLIAALIGATPGCGGMIAVAVAFVTLPNFPLAALVSAGIATSGDGIFPLLAANKKDALLITFAGLAVALAVGYAALVLGL
jgi:hypothetical protein